MNKMMIINNNNEINISDKKFMKAMANAINNKY